MIQLECTFCMPIEPKVDDFLKKSYTFGLICGIVLLGYFLSVDFSFFLHIANNVRNNLLEQAVKHS